MARPTNNGMYDGILQKFAAGVNVYYYGLKRAIEIASADNDEGNKIIIPYVVEIGEDLTVPSNVYLHFTNNGKISVTNGKTLTINGTIFSEGGEIFIGEGSVDLSNSTVISSGDEGLGIFGIKGDGVTDDTEAIQNLIDTLSLAGGGVLEFDDNKTYMIDAETSIQMKSNIDIIIPRGSTIKAIPNNLTSYKIFNCENISNFSFSGKGVIQGERDEHTGETGEYGFGINIIGCSYFNINGVTVKDCWGDGIYIADSASILYSSNGLLEDIFLYNNRRNNMSIVSAKNIITKDSIIEFANGTAPEAGIDLEPNAETDILENIVFDNVRTINNNEEGILIYLDRFRSTTTKCDIKIINCSDYGSKKGIRLLGRPQFEDLNVSIPNYTAEMCLEGGILIRDTNYKSNINLTNINIIDCNQDEVTGDIDASAVAVARDTYNDNTINCGGVTIDGLNVIGSKTKWNLLVYDFKNQVYMENVSVDGFKNLESIEDNYVFAKRTINFNFQDKLKSTIRYVDGAVNISGSRINRYYSTLGATQNVVLTLLAESNWGEFNELTFTNDSDTYSLQIDTTDQPLLPLQATGGKYIQTTEQGASITIGYRDGYWKIINKIGTWTAEA